jgi:hypothetical protein
LVLGQQNVPARAAVQASSVCQEVNTQKDERGRDEDTLSNERTTSRNSGIAININDSERS